MTVAIFQRYCVYMKHSAQTGSKLAALTSIIVWDRKRPFMRKLFFRRAVAFRFLYFRSAGYFPDRLPKGFPLVSLSRALICEPDFAAKLKSGAANESKCTACNGCFSVYRRRFVRCVQHDVLLPQLKKVFG